MTQSLTPQSALLAATALATFVALVLLFARSPAFGISALAAGQAWETVMRVDHPVLDLGIKLYPLDLLTLCALQHRSAWLAAIVMLPGWLLFRPGSAGRKAAGMACGGHRRPRRVRRAVLPRRAGHRRPRGIAPHEPPRAHGSGLVAGHGRRCLLLRDVRTALPAKPADRSSPPSIASRRAGVR
jgi:hypothetical protein